MDNARALLGKTNSKIQYLLVKSYYKLGDYEKAKHELEGFFSITPESESSSDMYNEMVVLISEIEERLAKQKKKKVAEDARKRKAAKEKERLEAKWGKGFKKQDGRFIAFVNGTVKDANTGLMWAARDNGSDILWRDAKKYCENYRGGGYTDWRMPTQDELADLYDENKRNSYGYGVTELIDITQYWVWASETRGPSLAAGLNFSVEGEESDKGGWAPKSIYLDVYRALPVRDTR